MLDSIAGAATRSVLQAQNNQTGQTQGASGQAFTLKNAGMAASAAARSVLEQVDAAQSRGGGALMKQTAASGALVLTQQGHLPRGSLVNILV